MKYDEECSCRINEDELRRFYIAANGDFSCLLSSIKKTIQWRENYRIFSEKELKLWSNLVFWHGFDMNRRPCLIVRLGLACLTLSSNERARFAQAVGVHYCPTVILFCHLKTCFSAT